jgi:hypothetical protein
VTRFALGPILLAPSFSFFPIYVKINTGIQNNIPQKPRKNKSWKLLQGFSYYYYSLNLLKNLHAVLHNNDDKESSTPMGIESDTPSSDNITEILTSDENKSEDNHELCMYKNKITLSKDDLFFLSVAFKTYVKDKSTCNPAYNQIRTKYM